MAKISMHQFLQEMRGDVDGFVVRKIRGKYFVSRKAKPGANYKPSRKQGTHRDRFKDASVWAMSVQRNPELLAYYTPFAKKRDLRVRAVAISDWFSVPTVDAVDLRRYTGHEGDIITIRASDPYGIVNVRVKFLDPAGHPLEGGKAIRHGKSWRYTATKTVPRDPPITIQIVATDRPSREGEWKATWPAEKS